MARPHGEPRGRAGVRFTPRNVVPRLPDTRAERIPRDSAVFRAAALAGRQVTQNGQRLPSDVRRDQPAPPPRAPPGGSTPGWPGGDAACGAGGDGGGDPARGSPSAGRPPVGDPPRSCPSAGRPPGGDPARGCASPVSPPGGGSPGGGPPGDGPSGGVMSSGGTSPSPASTPSARCSSGATTSGGPPSITLTTQSVQASPRTVQVSQSMTQPGSAGSVCRGTRRKSFTVVLRPRSLVWDDRRTPL